MPNFQATDMLYFRGSDTGSTLTPTGNYLLYTSDTTVVDGNNDGEVDIGFDYLQWGSNTLSFSTFTITINGNEYAIFQDDRDFYIPFDSSIDDLSSLHGTSVTQPISSPTASASTINCFAAGTRIATATGDVAVETLTAGQEILRADGGTSRVRWVGHQAVRPADGHLVVIRAGALGEGLPLRDLVVTGDHGMVLDGHVVNASVLINGRGITWADPAQMPQTVTVYHVETETHEALLAEGAPAETYVDYAARGAFANYQEYLELNGADRLIREMALPRISSRRFLPDSIRARLDDNAPRHADFAQSA
ncbi:Hint domain-containing protein [Mameliella sp. CS4]|uniref:Hint domain-containing protein n=1 Tax=Mameliella sp. CS4 TaxID=2862329 RepID=UPI001C5F0941|nr:Hint domain-containing protein [Mameliella sp. CS4]MBW4980987.1 Hint domain-containing protein [Mameliella sp. CS4]